MLKLNMPPYVRTAYYRYRSITVVAKMAQKEYSRLIVMRRVHL